MADMEVTNDPALAGLCTPIRQGYVATEDSACDRRAPLARWRVPPVASGQPCRSARRSCRGQAGAPPATWHALAPRRRIPNGARLRRGALYPRLATVLARPRAYAAPPAQPAGQQRRPGEGRPRPDPLQQRQESPAQRHHATAPSARVTEVGREHSSWSGHSGSVLAYTSAGHASDFTLSGARSQPQTGTSCRCTAVCLLCTSS